VTDPGVSLCILVFRMILVSVALHCLTSHVNKLVKENHHRGELDAAALRAASSRSLLGDKSSSASAGDSDLTDVVDDDVASLDQDDQESSVSKLEAQTP